MKLLWTHLARQELEAIASHSLKTWGRNVARQYVSDVRDAAKALAKNSELARPLKGSFRIYKVRSHYLILKVDETNRVLTIARVLHVAMDIERYLP